MMCAGLASAYKRDSQTTDQLYLSLPPHPSSNAEARIALAAFFRCHSRTDCEDSIGTFLIAIGEALSNAIEHSESQGFIEVLAWVRERSGIVIVGDHGTGFTLRGFSLPPADSERGRGLPLMRSCTDVLEIMSEPGVGTTVSLMRRL